MTGDRTSMTRAGRLCWTATSRPRMVGRYLEVDSELAKRAMRGESLKPVHARVELQVRNPRAHQRSGNAQRMGIELVHL